MLSVMVWLNVALLVNTVVGVIVLALIDARGAKRVGARYLAAAKSGRERWAAASLLTVNAWPLIVWKGYCTVQKNSIE